ncbi:DUF488 domain-containing protein [Elioraea sp.]|uniref:DUF488 domain-containing protein n=1 Tax=Elioraea sp. TaxID=2185103 RepID=UPI003F6F7322
MIETPNPILTIGHSTHPLTRFIALLKQHGVTAVADVRSAPYSRFNPQFNKAELERSLKAEGIRYVFLGRELGARSDDPACYEKGRVQYARLARTEAFRQGIERLRHGATEHRIACMCAEKEPLECHRTLLVARALDAERIEVAHIHADGRLESHAAAMDRLLDLTGLPRDDFFRSRAELVAEALARQEEQVAYVDAKLAAEDAR